MSLSRRDFIVTSLSAGAFALLPWRFAHARAAGASMPQPLDASPLQRVSPQAFSSTEFNGDDIERTHEILWNVDGYIARQGGLPAPSEEASVVIVGGGVAGLYAAYLLRDQRPIIIEQDRFFGGNSKGEILGQSFLSTGAAYIAAPSPDSDTGRLLQELELWDLGRIESAQETTVFLKDRFSQGFWQAATDPSSRADFERVYLTLKQVLAEFSTNSQDASWVNALDQMSFEEWLVSTFGSVHPHLHEYFQLYAWSSFVTSLDEISALQMLGFISAETESLMALPGGNSAITASLYHRLVAEMGRERLRNSSMVVDVRKEGESVRVTYADPNGQLRAIRAKACIFAAPKFVARRVVRGLSTRQEKAMAAIRYRGYVVANVFLDRAITAPSYELYCLQGDVPPSPTAMNPSPRAFTDICFGSWAQYDQTGNSVLTVYKAFAFDGDRQFLFNPGAHDKHKARIQAAIEPILRGMGLSGANVKGLRMTRWGHSMPVAARGLIASGIAEAAHQPVGGRIFFANQDNWANPSFETATSEARGAVLNIRPLL